MKKNMRGAALLIMLSIFLIALTVAAITRLSLNRTQIERGDVTTKALNQAREALLGFAASQATRGMLPCPANNILGDQAVPCTQLGLLPYRALGLPELRDGSGAFLWYAVAPQYTTAPLLPNTPTAMTLDAIPNMVFIVFAAESVVRLQQRTGINAIQFLEGENSDGDSDYTAIIIKNTNNSLTEQNDRAIGLTVGDFWTSI
jgi:hypothetical protein